MVEDIDVQEDEEEEEIHSSDLEFLDDADIVPELQPDPESFRA